MTGKKATHVLKTHSLYWHAVARGEKLFEIRRNDRFFQCGDIVVLANYDPEVRGYVTPSGHSDQADNACKLIFTIGPVLQGGQFGIEPGFCVFSLLPYEVSR